jgi:purine-binding chemotaxis protein CheW
MFEENVENKSSSSSEEPLQLVVFELSGEEFGVDIAGFRNHVIPKIPGF